MKKTFVIFAIVSFVFVMSASVMAANFPDVEGHWAQSYIQRWSEENIINGYEDSTFKPNNNITRAEFVAMLMRIFEPTKAADLSAYTDVNRFAWYYDVLSKASAMGAINGYDTNTMMPEAYITRQEAMVILNRILNLPVVASGQSFTDASAIAGWAKSAVDTFVGNGYVNGYEDGSIMPTANITRAEVTKILDKAIAKIITQPGEYDVTGITENIVVKAENVALKNTVAIKKVFVLNDVMKATLTLDSSKEIVVINATTAINNNDVVTPNEDSTSKDDSNTSQVGGVGGNEDGTASSKKKFVVTLTSNGKTYDVLKEGTLEDGTELTIIVDGKEIIAGEVFSKERFSSFKLNLLSALDKAVTNKMVSGSKLKNTIKKSGVDTSNASDLTELLGDNTGIISEIISGGLSGDPEAKEDAMIELGLMFLNMDYDSFVTLFEKTL